MGEYLSNLKENFDHGLREFSEHPIKYTFSVVKDLVKDYWDLGAAVLAGFAFNDYGGEVFGDARFSVVGAAGFASFLGAGKNGLRMVRNGYAGFASWFGFWSRGVDLPLSTDIGNYTVAALMATASLIMDRGRRKKRTASSENSKPQELLEKLVD